MVMPVSSLSFTATGLPAKSAAQAAKEAGRGRLSELGLTPDKGKEAVRSIIDGAREAARASAQAAAGTVRGGE
jgi:hypothetical protein